MADDVFTDPDETRELIEQVVGRRGVPTALADAVHERTGVTPLFVETTVQALLETDQLDPQLQWYPTDPAAGARVTVDEDSVGDALLFYASVEERPDGIYTTTSRSFAVVGVEETIAEAERVADEALAAVGDGLRVRNDIGKPALVERRIEHMTSLRDRRN
jgi:phosphoribosylamine-glycine ligase